MVGEGSGSWWGPSWWARSTPTQWGHRRSTVNQLVGDAVGDAMGSEVAGEVVGLVIESTVTVTGIYFVRTTPTLLERTRVYNVTRHVGLMHTDQHARKPMVVLRFINDTVVLICFPCPAITVATVILHKGS